MCVWGGSYTYVLQEFNGGHVLTLLFPTSGLISDLVMWGHMVLSSCCCCCFRFHAAGFLFTAHLSLALLPIILSGRRGQRRPFIQTLLMPQKHIHLLVSGSAEPLQTNDKPLMAFLLVCLRSGGSADTQLLYGWGHYGSGYLSQE